MTMSASSAPPSSGGRGTFSVAAWNIRCGRGNGLTFAAKGLAKMGVGCAILSEMKITDNRYARMTSGYKVLSTKAPSKHKGGIALLWQPDHEGFEVEAARVVTPNLITFQLVTGDERYYVMGIYIPPNDAGGETTFERHGKRARLTAAPSSWATLTSMLNTPVTNWRRHLPTCWTKSTWLIRLANSHFGSAASRRLGNAGLGTRSVVGGGYTPSQITSWPGRIGLRGSGRLASDLHRFMTPITTQLLLTYGKGEMGPSRPIDETDNGSPSRSHQESKTR
jgi:hypothetical protein